MEYVLTESIDITQVLEIRKRYSDSIANTKNIMLDGSKVQKTDAAGLQLLLSLFVTCQKKGIEIRWQSISDELVLAATVLGLDTALSCNNKN
ncbi:STAS domain-containing protein [Vibrio sp. Of7-15]|nr:STAS domain-containing protein [Vibrio sp. Of7-15]MCG7497933.1 STAS domain-containing protein [Vibrio sp. Of7-15]